MYIKPLLIFYLFAFKLSFSDPIISTGNIEVLQQPANTTQQYTYTYSQNFPSIPLFSCSFIGFELPPTTNQYIGFKITNLSVGQDQANISLAVQNTTWNRLYFSCAGSTGDPLQLFFMTTNILQTITETEYRSDLVFDKSVLKFQPTTTTIIIYPNLCTFKYYFYQNSTDFYLQPSVYHQNTVIGPIYFDATPLDFSYNNPFFSNNTIILAIANTAQDISWVQFTLVVHTVWTSTTNRFTGYSFIETDKPSTVNIYNSSDTIVNYIKLGPGAQLYILQGFYRLNMSIQKKTDISVKVMDTRHAVVGGDFFGIGADVYLYKSFWDPGPEEATAKDWQIVLIVLGVVAVVVGIGVGVYCCIRRRRAKYLEEQRRIPPRSDSNPAEDSANNGSENKIQMGNTHPHVNPVKRRKSFMSSFPNQLTNNASSIF